MNLLHMRALQLASSYADAVNRSDEDQWAACWAEDAVWTLGPDRVAVGREDIVRAWRSAMETVEAVYQHLGHGKVRGGNGSASGRWHFTERLWRADAPGSLLLAHYEDTYVEGPDGALRFSSRALHRTYLGVPDLSGRPAPRTTA